MAAIPRGSESQTEAVERVARQIRRSPRYVWSTVKLGRQVAARDYPFATWGRPRLAAGLFLFETLQHGPKPTKAVEDLAQNTGIKNRTLRRAAGDLGIEARRVGGKRGHWVWQFSAVTRKIFHIDG
jgi:hypothetical protein